MAKFLMLALVFVVGFASDRVNANIIYSVDRAFSSGPSIYGPAASVQGTITTDGTLGFLAEGNIIDWNLALAAGPFQVSITPSNSYFEYETYDPVNYNHGLFATPAKLDFLIGFSNSSIYSVFAFYGGTSVTGSSSTSFPNYFTWCIGTNFCSNDFAFPDELILIRTATSEGRTIIQHGQSSSETVAAAVPVPSSLILFGTLGAAVAAMSTATNRRRS